MTFDETIKHFGSVAKTATALGLSRAAVYAWKYRGAIPRLSQFQIQIVSKNALKADEMKKPQPTA